MKYNHPEIELFVSSIYWCINNHHNDFTKEINRTMTELLHNYNIQNSNYEINKTELIQKLSELYGEFEKIDIYSIIFIMNPYMLMLKDKFCKELDCNINSYIKSIEKLMVEYLSI